MSKPQTLNDIIAGIKNRYMASKTTTAANDFDQITSFFINILNQKDKEIKALLEKMPKKDRVKIIKKGK